MSVPLWVGESADAFWTAVGFLEPFPRGLLRPIALALPITVVLLPKLRVSAIDEWLWHQNVRCNVGVGDRCLRACLIARYDQGIVFVDGSDPAEEQRLSIAHELAHFLRDYWQPRRLAVQRLGADILDVLDGRRPATGEERAVALLARVDLGYRVHLMERAELGDPATGRIAVAEDDADRLAFEILAPADVVLQDVSSSCPQSRTHLTARLIDVFGLPPVPAARYAHLLLPETRPSDSLLRRLGLPA